jgi:hypothetical protein
MWGSIGISTLVAFVFFTFIIKASIFIDTAKNKSLTYARRGKISKQLWSFTYQVKNRI